MRNDVRKCLSEEAWIVRLGNEAVNAEEAADFSLSSAHDGPDDHRNSAQEEVGVPHAQDLEPALQTQVEIDEHGIGEGLFTGHRTLQIAARVGRKRSHSDLRESSSQSEVGRPQEIGFRVFKNEQKGHKGVVDSQRMTATSLEKWPIGLL
jgi:hypothetical protein